MKIAVLGWGSVIWNKGKLRLTPPTTFLSYVSLLCPQ